MGLQSWRLTFALPALLVAAAGLMSTLPTANAGGKTLTPQESAQFLSLFRRICSSGSPQQEGNTYYFCKQPDSTPIRQQVSHEAEVSAADTPKQVIFVQSPTYEYQHNVNLRGSAGNPQQTEIYVLPPKINHELKLEDVRTGVKESSKPSLFYLSNNRDGQQGGNLIGTNSGSSSNAGFGLIAPGTRDSSNTGDQQRPSSPPFPNPNSPGVISGGYQYGPPDALGNIINARNQRNVVRAAYRAINH